MSDLQKTIKNFSNDFLLEQYFHKKNEYTEDAITYMQQELALRNLSIKDLPATQQNQQSSSLMNTLLSKHEDETFVAFNHVFSQTDILLLHSLFLEEHIPFLVDTTMSSDMLPFEAEASRLFTIHLPESLKEKAQLLVEQHFEHKNGVLSPKFANVLQLLKSFNFNDLHLDILQSEEQITVQFSDEERKAILFYLTQLLHDADSIEQKGDVILFYYDNIETCMHNISNQTESLQLSRIDLLTIIEAFKIYCETSDFPHVLDKTIESILNFLKQ